MKKSTYEVINKCELNTVNNDKFFISISLFDNAYYFLYMSGKHGYLNIPMQDIPELIEILEEAIDISNKNKAPLR